MNGINICHSIMESIGKLVKSDDFQMAYRIGNCFSRKRKLVFENLIYFLLHQSKKSLSINIADFLEDFPQLGICEISKQAISKARKGISVQGFAELMRVSTLKYYELCESPKTWHGYHVFGVDGTALQMPQTEQNIKEFGISTNQSGTEFAMASASILFDIMNDIIIDAQINVCNYSERKFALQHLMAFDSFTIGTKSIILFDRGYPSFDMFRKLTEQNRLFVMRLKNSTKALNGISTNDAIIDYGPNYPKGNSTRLRVIRIPLESDNEEVLITNIFDPQITIDMFKELYFLRWGVEGKYQELKNQLQLENFSGSSPLVIRQDFYITAFFSNIVSIIKKEVDLAIQEEIRHLQGRHSYQGNRGFLINRIKKHLVKMLLDLENATVILRRIIYTAQKVRSQIQPDRKYERKVRHKKRKHHHNRKPCL
jgi:hypothetical protein